MGDPNAACLNLYQVAFSPTSPIWLLEENPAGLGERRQTDSSEIARVHDLRNETQAVLPFGFPGGDNLKGRGGEKMSRWCMSCNGEADSLTNDIWPNTAKNVRKLRRIRIVVCGRCWRSRTWEY